MFTFIPKIKYQLLLLFCLLAGFAGITQPGKDNRNTVSSVYSKTVSAGSNIPIPYFSNTHSLGIGANFSWSKNRFGLMNKKPSTSFGFIADGGIDYYLGKKETIASYEYNYNNFTYIHAYGGIIYNCCRRGNINITAGPALGLQDGHASFWWGVNLSGAYYLNKKIAITPGLILMKDQGSDPLFSCSVKASFAF